MIILITILDDISQAVVLRYRAVGELNELWENEYIYGVVEEIPITHHFKEGYEKADPV